MSRRRLARQSAGRRTGLFVWLRPATFSRPASVRLAIAMERGRVIARQAPLGVVSPEMVPRVFSGCGLNHGLDFICGWLWRGHGDGWVSLPAERIADLVGAAKRDLPAVERRAEESVQSALTAGYFSGPAAEGCDA